ncbi:hypothetical protein FACS189473_5680 [Spirochaetia bacterium]|nr:hypothetical protein FACS189473_5680 [Spirochaetia bacterium]
MKTFYCVMTEFYDNGAVKAAMTSRECREKPRDTFRGTFRMDAYCTWYADKTEAEAALTEARREGAA